MIAAGEGIMRLARMLVVRTAGESVVAIAGEGVERR